MIERHGVDVIAVVVVYIIDMRSLNDRNYSILVHIIVAQLQEIAVTTCLSASASAPYQWHIIEVAFLRVIEPLDVVTILDACPIQFWINLPHFHLCWSRMMLNGCCKSRQTTVFPVKWLAQERGFINESVNSSRHALRVSMCIIIIRLFIILEVEFPSKVWDGLLRVILLFSYSRWRAEQRLIRLEA